MLFRSHSLDTLELKFYPRQTSSYILWEDDGITFAYEKGDFSKTKIDCVDTGDHTKITFNPVEGRYEGMPKERTWELEIFSDTKPSYLLVNGIRIDDWKYGKGAVQFTLYQGDLNKKQIIEIQK